MVGGSTVKEMTTNFGKLDKFEGHDFRQWQKKMHFLLTTLKVVYVLTTPMPDLLENDTVEAIRQIANVVDYFESKYMAEDAYSKKFLVSNFNNYKVVDSRHVMEQFNELLRILGQYTQHGLKMDESISVSSVIDKLPPSLKDFKHSLKHGKDDLSLVQLGSHLCIEESLRVHESDKGKGKEVAGPSVSMVEEGGKNKNNKQTKGKKHGFKENNGGSGFNNKPKLECWKCGKTCHFKKDCRSGNKKNNANAGGSGKRSKDQSQDQGDDHFAPVHGKGSVVLEFSSRKSITFQIQENKKRRDEHAEIISSTKNLVSGSSAEASQRRKKSIYSSFQDLRLSCNEDMVKYKGQWPSTTQARALNEKSNKKIPPATS
ncbi:zinc finger, CCHC-type containing protein [Tanacetum coccineum]|uniref:Zinc finger, CCHC-type containing protein n=1 Tax=Tanacetum coccineum TaxID=301880 RepID=A0ABQ4WT50_9ASTR